jgi:tripartite-type tricarboxylate transporter receptor subunit TctC
MIRNLLAVALLAAAVPAAAQDYPAKPIQMLMPLQAGSAVDAMLRIVAEKMSQNMGRQIVIENQPRSASSPSARRRSR